MFPIAQYSWNGTKRSRRRHRRQRRYKTFIERQRRRMPHPTLPNDEKVFQKMCKEFSRLCQSTSVTMTGKASAIKRAKALIKQLKKDYPSRADVRIRMLNSAIRIERHNPGAELSLLSG